MKNLKAELMVGIFTIAVMAVLAFMTMRAGDLSMAPRDGILVHAFFNNTAGLDTKTKAKIAGVDAGVIESITLDGGRAKVSIRMYPNVILFDNASAHIKATGLLGDKYVELRPGNEGEVLKDGAVIGRSYDTADIDELVTKLSAISDDLGGFVAELNDEDFKRSLRNTMANLEDITQRIRQDTPEIMDDLKAAIAELREVMDNAGPKVQSIAKKIDSAMDNIQSIARKIDEGEGTIGKLVNDGELYTSINNAAKGLDRTLGSITRFRTFVNFRGEHISKYDATKGYFDVTLSPRPERTYIIGIVTNPVGKAETTITITNSTTVTEQDKIEDEIQFVAQFGRRWHNTQLRIGILENTFSVGADQFFLKDRLKVTFDVWDFNGDEYLAEDPHMKVWADMYVTRNLYVSAGYDNFMNDYREGVFFGAGLRFEDEDFKYILGTATSTITNQ